MNLSKWLYVCRIICVSILVITLVSITLVQWMKFSEENTNISVSYVERDFNLPSMTICPEYWGENPQQGRNITFQEFMEGVLDESKFFLYAEQNIFLPGKK